MQESKFSFTITDAARFLNKSPVTLRKWEKQGIISYPRYHGTGDRRFELGDIRVLAEQAFVLKRISQDRLDLIIASVTILRGIERSCE